MNDLHKLRLANVTREEAWPGAGNCDSLFFAVEFGGEAGELLDAVKKLVRFRRGIAGNTGQTEEDLVQAAKEELGDVLISVDNLARSLDLDIYESVPMKFNKTSHKVDVPVFMDPDWNCVCS